MTPVPPAHRDDIVDVVHGTRVPDPYRWLEDAEASDTRRWVSEQNERTRQALDARPDRSRWHERLVALMQLPQTGSGMVKGGRLFNLERPAGAEQFRLVVRSADDRDDPVRVLIDPGAMAADAAAAIDWYQPSPDGELVAYGMSEGGTESSVLRVVRTADGSHLAEEIPDCRAASVAWLPDVSGFWYTRYPAGDEYNRTVRFHVLGTPHDDDPQVWHDATRKETWPSVTASRDGRHLLIHAMKGWSDVEVHLCHLESGSWRSVSVGDGVANSFRFGGDGLIGLTMLDAPRGRIVTLPIEEPTEASVDAPTPWRTLVAERPVVIGGFTLTRDELVVVVTDVAVDQLERYSPTTGALLGGIEVGVASVSISGSIERDDVFLGITGFTEPLAQWRWTVADGLVRWAPDVPAAGTIPSLAVSYRSYPSLDGAEIGIFLIHGAEVTPGPDTPAILNGYGGFSITETPSWSPSIAAWCEAGGLYAIAGLRGGFEHGQDWHDAGRRGNKQNVFDDFHAAADWLCSEGLTSRGHLGVAGGSNGGLLVGASLTQRPAGCRAVWCAVPLLDMIRFPQFLIARLWTDEYGDPDIAEEFAWLWGYSPYHHVVEGEAYPAVLLTTGEGDTRVDPLHARKMAALLQWASSVQDDRPILFHQEGRAGHGAGKPVSKRAEEAADVLTFFDWQLRSA